MTDLAILKAATLAAQHFADGKPWADVIAGADVAAVRGYEQTLMDEADVIRRDLWDAQQELIYRMAFAQQLVALGL